MILEKERAFFKEAKPLLGLNDRISFITFGDPNNLEPKISIVYDSSFDLEGFLKGLFPKKGDFTNSWTYLELLYSKVGFLALKYPNLITLRVLISDKAESKPSINEDDQKGVFWYKEHFSELPLFDLEVGGIHLEITQIIPPKSGIEIIEPKPFTTYFKNKELSLKVRVLYQGKPQKKAKVFALLSNKRKEKIPFFEKGGLYFGTLTSRSHSLNISFFAYDKIHKLKVARFEKGGERFL